jgi:dTDP-glucose 4,6-dehydratase
VGSFGVYYTLEFARRQNAKYLFSSTSEVYGDPEISPQVETYWGRVNPNGPRSQYDEAKRFAEALIVAYRRQHKTDCKIIRIFNTYGPRMRKDDGRVVPNFISQALARKPLSIYGEGYQTRSFCYVDDLVEGIVSMMHSREIGPVNLGNPDEFMIRDLAEEVAGVLGIKVKLQHLAFPTDDPKMRCPDITLAKEKLQWQPKIGLKEGLNRTIKWFRDN